MKEVSIIRTGRPKIQKPKNFPPRCENIIKMIRVTFWVLVFAKTQKGSFIKSTKTQKPYPIFLFLAYFTLFITFLIFSDNFEVIKSVYFLQNVKKT
jgi:hypothetical protein